MSLRGGGLPARAVGALFIVPFGAGLLIWPYGTLPLTALLIILAAREGAQIVGAISGGASAAWSAALLVVPLAALQHAHAAALSMFVQLRHGGGKVGAIELVVARDKQRGLHKLPRPRHGLGWPVQVARQHHHIGLGGRRVHRVDRQVQVRKQGDFHGARCWGC